MTHSTHDFTTFFLAQLGTKEGTAAPGIGAAPATSAPGTAPAPGGAGAGGAGGMGFMLPLLLVFLAVMIIPQILSGRKEKKKREAMMSTLGKGDRVLTVGGQIGVVDQVREQEVVLRIDENSNVKARFTKAAIQQVLDATPKTEVSPSVEVKARNDTPIAAR